VTHRLALVMSGGGARGALQVGAVRALLEADYRPEILVGTSIGAGNAAILGLHGVDENGLAALTRVYQFSAEKQILGRDYLRLALRALVRRPATEPSRRIREFFLANGITPELRFDDLKHARVLAVATDINHYARVIYGLDPAESVLEGLLASTAIPPWVTPLDMNGRRMVDGAFVSNLPIEAALSTRPRQIIALDVHEWREVPEDSDGFGDFFNKVVNTVQKRQFDLEMAVAAARHIPVNYIPLFAEQPAPVYAFERWEELIARGYEQTRQTIQKWLVKRKKRFFFSS
jgi:NTE family protein